MTIFGRVVRWLRGRLVWAGNRYDPRDSIKVNPSYILRNPWKIRTFSDNAYIRPPITNGIGNLHFTVPLVHR
jgi:hypothetical protein